MAQDILDPEFLVEMERRYQEEKAQSYNGDELYGYGTDQFGMPIVPEQPTAPKLPPSPPPSLPQEVSLGVDTQLEAPVVPEGLGQPAEPQPTEITSKQSSSYSRPAFMTRGTGGFKYGNESMVPDMRVPFELGSQARAAQGSSIDRQAEIQTQADLAKAEGEQSIADEQEMQVLAIEQEAADRRQILEQQQEEIRSLYQAIPQMQRGQIWANSSNMTKAMGAMSAVINGWLNPGGENATIKTMMRMVDQDMEEQQANINVATEQARAGEREFTRTADMLDAQFKQNQLARVAKIAQMRTALDAQIAKMVSPLNQEKANMLKAQLLDEESKALQSYMQTDYQNKMDFLERDRAIRASELSARVQQGQLNLQRRKYADAQKAAAQQMSFGEPLFALDSGANVYARPGIPVTDTERTKIREAVAANNEGVDAVKGLMKLRLKYGDANTPDQLARAQAEIARYIESKRSLVGANLPEAEAQRVTSLAVEEGLFKQWLQSDEVARDLLNGAMRGAAVKLNEKLSPYGAYVPSISNGQLTATPYDTETHYRERYTMPTDQEVKKQTIRDQVTRLAPAVERSLKAYNENGANEGAREAYITQMRALMDTAEEYNWDKADLSKYRQQIESLVRQLPHEMRQVPTTDANGYIQFVDPLEYLDTLQARDKEKSAYQRQSDEAWYKNVK